MLAVLVILMLVPTWTDGVLLTKCELRSKLKAALPELQGETSEELIAKLACMVENISGFNTSFVTITSFNPQTLIRAPFPYNEDGFGELSYIGNAEYVFPENTPTDVVVTEEPLFEVDDEEFFSEGAEVQPKESAVLVEGQDRKKRDAPSGGDGSWISEGSSGEEPTNQPEETQENNGLPGPTDVYYDTYEMLFGQTTLPPETTNEPEDIPYDTYEMLYDRGGVPPDTANEPEDKYYDIYRMIFGPRGVPPETTNKPEDIHYDTYEMLVGPTDKSSLDGPLDTTGLGKGRSKRSSEHQTVFYGIFQLNGVTCDSGSSNSPNICGLHCSALTDDDITDDISCLTTLKEKVKGMALIPSWMFVDPSQYFAECG